MLNSLILKNLKMVQYTETLDHMRDFTKLRTMDTPDECWQVEHYPVFTQGQAGKAEHILDPGQIPVAQSDRGGQVTYHGPGQLVLYLLLDLKRKSIGIKQLISAIENAIIALLASYQITGSTHCKAPGVYVEDRKIASLGLRIRHGRCYHGLSLNVAMDTAPFKRINPCGYPDLKVVQMSDFVPNIQIPEVSPKLLAHLTQILGYTNIIANPPIEEKTPI